MSALPKAVQKQLDQAEELARQLSAPEQSPATPEEAPPAEVVELRPEEAPPQPAAAPSEDADALRQRYEVLNGKYRAEVPRLHDQLRQSHDQLREAMVRIAELEDKVRSVPAPVPTPDPTHVKDIEAFGEDMVEFVNRVTAAVVRREVAAAASELRKEFGAQVGAVVNRVDKSQMDTFWDLVRKEVPDWEAVDADERWAQFLETRAPGTARSYRDLATEAVKGFNPRPIAEIVAAWRASLPSESKAQGGSSTPRPSNAASSELNRQVTPASSRASVPGAPQPKVWTLAEYEQAFDHRNRLKMTPADWNRLMAEADAALAEGRVR